MSNPFIPADDFVPGLKLEYNFTNKSNGSNTLTGECNACLTSGILYDLYLHDIDYNGNNNASLISKIKSNIEYIHISSTNFDGVLFNASHISYESNITAFNASLSASSTQSFPVGPAIVDFVLTRGIAGSGGGGGDSDANSSAIRISMTNSSASLSASYTGLQMATANYIGLGDIFSRVDNASGTYILISSNAQVEVFFSYGLCIDANLSNDKHVFARLEKYVDGICTTLTDCFIIFSSYIAYRPPKPTKHD